MNLHDLEYRPLVSGVSIVNPRVREPGTLGYIATAAGGGFWLVSAYHVLCNVDLSAYVADEAIYQPAAVSPGFQVATTRRNRMGVALDCAAAEVKAGMVCVNRQLGIGMVGSPLAPVAGMRVMKSGAVSGVTEGLVTAVVGDTVTVGSDPDFPAEYVLSQPGDSGALWVEQQSRRPVALHLGHSSTQMATASNFARVLQMLELNPF